MSRTLLWVHKCVCIFELPPSTKLFSLFQEGVKITRTPPCFSLGMDDWLVDIEYEHEDRKVSHDQQRASHDQQGMSHDHRKVSHDRQISDRFDDEFMDSLDDSFFNKL